MTDISKFVKPKEKGTGVAFKNPVLERLTRTNTAVPVIIFLATSAVMVYWGITETAIAAWTIAGVYVGALLLFTLVEYLVHRYLFHMITNTKLKENLQYAFHGIHHDHPKDTGRLAMPPVVSVLIVVALFYLFRWIMGDYVFAFLPGFISGYSLYLIVHHVVHAFQPPKNAFKILWVHHGIHHYKDHERAFGVSSPLWDLVFRTMPRKQKSHS